MTERPVVVFDTMIYLQGLIKESGPAVDCFELFERRKIILVVSEEIVTEIAEVLTRPILQSAFSRLTGERIEKLLRILRKSARVLKKVPKYFEYPRDTKDEKFINAAIEADARYLVTRDNDLLDLMTDHTDEAKTFRQRFRHMKIIDPAEFLQIVREMYLVMEP